MTSPDTKPNPDEEDLRFRLLRQLDLAPDASQRATAAALGVSLGGLNTQLRTAADAGLITISDRPGPDKRQRYTYTLTRRGGAEKREWHALAPPQRRIVAREGRHAGR